MPNYTGAAGSTVLAPTPPPDLVVGDSVFLFGTIGTGTQLPPVDATVAAETPAVGQASISAAVAPDSGQVSVAYSVEIKWTANPGAATVLVQEADTDADAFYITPSNTTYTISTFATVGTVFVARADFSPTGGKFVRVKVSANPNAAALTVKLTKQ